MIRGEQFTEGQIHLVKEMLEQEYDKGVRWGVALTVGMGLALTLLLALYSRYGHHLL
jgi:hypothetical protein